MMGTRGREVIVSACQAYCRVFGGILISAGLLKAWDLKSSQAAIAGIGLTYDMRLAVTLAVCGCESVLGGGVGAGWRSASANVCASHGGGVPSSAHGARSNLGFRRVQLLGPDAYGDFLYCGHCLYCLSRTRSSEEAY